MPSRAVIRKKARRESKRRKLERAGTARGNVVGRAARSVDHHRGAARSLDKLMPAKRLHTAEERREPAGADNEEENGGVVGRRERRRLEAKRRLERQLSRLNAAAGAETTAATNVSDSTATPAATDCSLRHDPRFKNGTFWRTRKELRGRTVFLGNMPKRFTVQGVTDFLCSMIDASSLQNDEKEAVEAVNFLPAKPRAVCRHMFVTLRSKVLAERVIELLDSYQLDGVALRCNMAADKLQRGEAILRRSGTRPSF